MRENEGGRWACASEIRFRCSAGLLVRGPLGKSLPDSGRLHGEELRRPLESTTRKKQKIVLAAGCIELMRFVMPCPGKGMLLALAEHPYLIGDGLARIHYRRLGAPLVLPPWKA